MRALTALRQAGRATQQDDGRPPQMPLTRIVKDPENPRPPLHLRTPDEQQQQAELNENVRERGVKSPISLRPHPSEPDTWVINHGHCRYDAAVAAGFATIPYFVDPNFDSYDQIAENLHRSDLSIWAIASFIKRKLDEGQSKTEIAQRLGKDGLNYVTEHLALVDAPGCVHQAYASAVRSPRTLYDLRRAHDEFPEQVDAWCQGGARITRDAIKQLLDGLRHDVIGPGSSPGGHLRSVQSESDGAARIRDRPGDAISSKPASGVAETAKLRHDVIDSILQADKPKPGQVDGERRSTVPATTDGGLRHDVILRHAPSSAVSEQVQEHKVPSVHGPANEAGPHAIASGQDIRVRYKGRNATVASDSKVMIDVDGEKTEVRLADLEFLGTE
jgi:ParB family chromosome partitioning protein